MTETTNLQLPLFEAGDAVDLIATYNAAMQILDSAVGGIDTKLTKTSTAFTVGDLEDAVLTEGGYVAVPDPTPSNN